MQLAGKKNMIWINNRILRLSWQCFKTVPVYAQLFNVLFCIFIIVPRHWRTNMFIAVDIFIPKEE